MWVVLVKANPKYKYFLGPSPEYEFNFKKGGGGCKQVTKKKNAYHFVNKRTAEIVARTIESYSDNCSTEVIEDLEYFVGEIV